MAFEGGRYRETRHGGGFGSSSGSAGPGDDSGGAASTLQDLESELVKFRGCIDSVGTQFDDNSNRREMKRLRSVIKSKVSEAQTQLKAGKKAKDPQSRILMDRQSNQLETQISTFQTLLDKEKSALKSNPAPSGQSDEGNGGVGGGYHDDMNARNQGMQAQSQMQRMGQLEEREEQARELQELERDIQDLQEVHIKMGELVEEQGDDIDRIDKNVSQAQTRTEHGKGQLQQAVVTIQQSRKLKIAIVALVVGVVLIILIIVAILLGVFIPRNDS